MKSIKHLQINDLGAKVDSISIRGNQNKEVIEELSACAGNVKTLRYSGHCMEWLTVDILSKWKLKEIDFSGILITKELVSLIVQTCLELTSIKLDSTTVDDAVVSTIAQHYPKLEILKISECTQITSHTLIMLSKYKLPLKELSIPYIPHISSINIARRCSYALSRITHLNTKVSYQDANDITKFLPYMTGLTSVHLNNPYFSIYHN